MTFGDDWGWGSSVSDAILARYLELGGNFIDTANLYTDGHAKKIIGDTLWLTWRERSSTEQHALAE